jgi:predicted PurR-regulated permease PerM
MNFLDKINSDFKYWKCDFRWDIIIFLIVSVISFIVLIFILIIIIHSKINDLKNEDIRLNLISNLDKDFINPNENKINEIKEIEESNQINMMNRKI